MRLVTPRRSWRRNYVWSTWKYGTGCDSPISWIRIGALSYYQRKKLYVYGRQRNMSLFEKCFRFAFNFLFMKFAYLLSTNSSSQALSKKKLYMIDRETCRGLISVFSSPSIFAYTTRTSFDHEHFHPGATRVPLMKLKTKRIHFWLVPIF